MSQAPLRVLVVSFDHPDFSGEIEAELDRLEAAGTLRVLGDGPEQGYEVDDSRDVWFVADSIAPGDAAAVIVLEHRWAIPLREAIERAGGRDVVAEWADADDLAALGVA